MTGERTSYRLFVLVSMLSLVFIAGRHLSAAQLNATYIPASGNWNVAANWSTNQVPNNNVTDSFNCLLGGSVVTLDLGPSIDNLSIGATGSLGIGNARTLTVSVGPGAGTVTNSGLLTLNSTGSNTSLVASGGQITLTGSGTVTMSNSTANRITGAAGGSLLNVNNTIQGSGQVGANTMDIANQSLIVANQTANLTIDPLTSLTNTGTLRASGGTLILGTGTYNNVGGVIEALNGSFVDLNNATIVGGTLQTVGSGEIRTTSAEAFDGSISAVTNLGAVNVRSADTVTLLGTLSNTGAISLNSIGGNTELIASGGQVTLTGGGMVTMGNHSANRVTGAAGGSLLNVNNTIQGSGQIGVNAMDIANQSLIVATQSNNLTIDPLTTFTNTGTLRASGGILVLATGNYNNVGGVIEALNGSFVDLSNAIIVGGTLQTVGTGEIRTTSTETLDGSANTVTNLGTVNVRSGDTLTVLGTLSNAGTISVNSMGSNTELIASGGQVTLTGGGTVTMGNLTTNRITGASGGSLLNVNNTIQGSGQIGVNTMNITNQSLIAATQSASLTIDPLTTFINTGALRASGGTLILSPSSYNNVGGVIEALNGSFVDLNGSTIVGGTLQTVGSGEIRTTSTETLDGSANTVANLGTVNVRSGDTLTLLGTLSNAGTISLNSMGSNTDLIASGGQVTLTGGGTVTMGNATTNRIAGVGSLLNVNNIIQGSGNIGINVLEILNQGSIIANGSVALSIDPSDTASFVNQGNLQATGTGGLALASGPFATSGTVVVASGSSINRTGLFTQTAGSTTVNGTLMASGGVDIQGGTLGGSGTVASAVTNGATLAPGQSAGILSLSSSYSQSSGGELSIEVGGLMAGSQYDRLAVVGNASLDGTLRLVLINGFVPNPGDTFTIMTFGSHSGTFSNVIVPCGPGGNLLQVTVNATSVVVSVVPGLEGDVTCDCVITSEDISAFVLALTNPMQYAATYPSCNILSADFNNDALVNGLDAQGFVDVLTP